MIPVGDVVVSDGLFTVLLDFGSGAFAAQGRWLQLAVREGSSTAGYSQLPPRQQLTAAPYALHAAQAGSVNWRRVQNRPAGLDDGDDDTTYTAGAGLALGSLALAQSGALQVAWWTVDGGGGTASGGAYTVGGTIAQPEAGGLSGDGHYTVTGGFWGAAAQPPGGKLFLPILQRP